jgi:spore germination cell wall hydrolase CwlJ-like protein
MSVMRNRPKGARIAFFGLAFLIFALNPTEIGYQDIASLLARQPGVGERWQKRVLSAVSGIQVATYSFGRPIGTSMPQAGVYQLASFDGSGIEGQALTRNHLLQAPPHYQASDYPKVNRTLKGDRLVTMPPPESTAPTGSAPALESPSTPNSSVMGEKTADAAPSADHPALDPELQEALDAPPLEQYRPSELPTYDISLSLEAHPFDDLKSPPAVLPSQRDASHGSFTVQTASLYFGSSLGAPAETMEHWDPGAAPTVMVPDALNDPDMKMASLPSAGDESARPNESGESVAPKGEVNADNQHEKTPAERLGLIDARSRAKSEKCLAEAVYFEARGEAVRGQIAVAQVVMNRVFSGFYPTTVCGVVYQNKYHHMACQFTFACDNVADVVREPDMWDRARRIAKAMLDGQLWLPEVGKSTHYHAYWVHPSWVAEMKKMYKFGVHTFYRPKAWGDGSDEPSWGSPAQTAEISAELTEAAKSTAEQSETVIRR